jgi:hypothetical protein
VGRIKRGCGDGGDPVRSPQGRPSSGRLGASAPMSAPGGEGCRLARSYRLPSSGPDRNGRAYPPRAPPRVASRPRTNTGRTNVCFGRLADIAAEPRAQSPEPRAQSRTFRRSRGLISQCPLSGLTATSAHDPERTLAGSALGAARVFMTALLSASPPKRRRGLGR